MTHLTQGMAPTSINETRKVSGFESNVEKVDRALNDAWEYFETLQRKINCTLLPSVSVTSPSVDDKKCQNEPVVSEFESVMKMFCDRIDSLANRIVDTTSRCTL